MNGENVVLLVLVLTAGEYASLRLWLRHRATQKAADRKAVEAGRKASDDSIRALREAVK